MYMLRAQLWAHIQAIVAMAGPAFCFPHLSLRLPRYVLYMDPLETAAALAP